MRTVVSVAAVLHRAVRSCSFEVDSVQALLFDDSFEHEALWPPTHNSSRVVLLVDLFHPELSQSHREAAR